MKVITIVGTRPELIRLSRVIWRLDRAVDHVLVHTGQNFDYELNGIFFDDLEIRRPDYFLESAGSSGIETISNILRSTEVVLKKEMPDAVLILGDTNSCLSAITAKKMKIPIFHMEAGNRCFDDRVPEEINRRIVDHIADINMPYSDISREYLLREGIMPDRIIKTGSPMFEVLNVYRQKITDSKVLSTLNLNPNDYYLVSAHREELVETQEFNFLIESLNAIANKFERRIIFSTHPRTRNRILRDKIELHECIELLKPLSFSDYNKLQLNASAVLSDSGTISEESSILNFRALNIRYSHERPEAMEEGAVIMCGTRKEVILKCLDILDEQTVGEDRSLSIVSDYCSSNVSEKVLRIIMSYTQYININVWKKTTDGLLV